MIGAQIAGLGIALPETELTNAELAPRLGVTEEWIVERTGIHCRRIASEGQDASSLGIEASLRALEDADITGEDIDLIVCATVTPRWRFPATACLIQNALGARSAAFDLNAGCSGWLYALVQADAVIRSGGARRALVVGADVLSRITDYSDPKSSILFGDGAGAVVVERCDGGPRLGPFSLHSDGSRPQLLFVPNDTGVIHMAGRDVYRAAVSGMVSSVTELLGSSGIASADVDLLVAHQANKRILDAVASRLGIDADRIVSNIAAYGNTSAASIPIALFDARRSGLLRQDNLVVMTAFGAGFAWGAGLARWGTNVPAPRTLVTAGEANV
ncbi:MAG: beta-ketoacyl-ACP synthase III [Actinomycetota bacterium]